MKKKRRILVVLLSVIGGMRRVCREGQGWMLGGGEWRIHRVVTVEPITIYRKASGIHQTAICMHRERKAPTTQFSDHQVGN